MSFDGYSPRNQRNSKASWVLKSAKTVEGRLHLTWLAIENGTAGLTYVDRYSPEDAQRVIDSNPTIMEMLASETEAVFLNEDLPAANSPMFGLSDTPMRREDEEPTGWDSFLKRFL